MKVSREQAAQNRERIVEAAAQRFRERGFEGIGVADLMKEAGLTHGGFYGHFSSKEDLIGEASVRALTALGCALEQTGGACATWSAGRDRRRLFDQQTSRQSGRGLSAGGARTGRVATGYRRAARGHRLVRATVDLLANLVPRKSKAARRQKAIITYATLVGAMVMARAVDDRALSREILDAGLASVKD